MKNSKEDGWKDNTHLRVKKETKKRQNKKLREFRTAVKFISRHYTASKVAGSIYQSFIDSTLSDARKLIKELKSENLSKREQEEYNIIMKEYKRIIE